MLPSMVIPMGGLVGWVVQLELLLQSSIHECCSKKLVFSLRQFIPRFLRCGLHEVYVFV